MQEPEALECPLWVRVTFRLLCGALSAVILGVFGWYRGDHSLMVGGVVLGAVGGLVYGERAIGGIISAWFYAGHPPR